jgi:L-threonine kinase
MNHLVADVVRHAGAVGVSSAFGTFGELLQGVTADGVDFLVTLPIARWTTAMFTVEPDVPGIRVCPRHKHKAVRLARAMASAVGYTGGGRLTLDSDIPEGKGLASSSADLVATARAVANALALTLTPAAIEELLRPIEPTDGVMYEGITAFDHRRVRLRARLGVLPPMTIVGLDEGGVVDTIAFNRRPKPFDGAQRREYDRLLAGLAAAVRRADLAAIGSIATRSAELNQQLQPKRAFAALCAAGAEIGTLGIVVAHSGSVAGLLLADDDPAYDGKRAAARQVCLDLTGGVIVDRSLTALPTSEDPAPCHSTT